MRSIKRKMLVYFIASTFVLFTAAMGLIAYKIVAVLDGYAYDAAAQYAHEGAVVAEDSFREGIETLRNTARVVEVLKAEGRTDREILQPVFLETLKMHDSAIALWVLFEPDGWDGRDAEFAGTEGYDELGNYAVWAFRGEDGEAEVSIEAWGAECYAEDYYAGPMERDGLWFGEPYEEEMDVGVTVRMMTLARAIRDPAGAAIGVVGIDFPITFLNGILAEIDAKSGGASSLATYEGVLLADTLFDATGSLLSDSQSADTVSAASALLGDGAAERTYVEATMRGIPTLQMLEPVRLDESLDPWLFIVSIPKALILKVPAQIYMGLLLAGLAMLAALVLLIVVISSKISRPLVDLTDTFSVIASGDFRPEARIHNEDETGRLAEGFNRLTESLSRLLGALKGDVAHLASNAARLSDEMRKTGSAFHSTERSIDNATLRGSDIAAGLEDTTASVDRIRKSIHSLEQSSRSESELIMQSVAAIETMLARIGSVTGSVIQASEYYGKLNQTSAFGADLLSDVFRKIQDVNNQSEDLLATNSVIAGIAAQTNLLAMNAAIEAAHAGDSGKGFAVVADEIRKLSASASDQSKSIKKMLAEVAGTIGAIADSSKKAGDNFEEIRTLIKTITRLEEEVKTAMEEQSAGSNQILSSLDAMKAASTDMDADALSVSDIAGQIALEVEALNRYSEDVQSSIEDVRASNAAIRSAVDEAMDMTEDNTANIGRMIGNLGVFKLKGEGPEAGG